MGRKRSKCGTYTSVEENMAAPASNQDLKDSIISLTKVVTKGFQTIHSDMDKLPYEFKIDLDKVRDKIKKLEVGLTYHQEEVSSLNEKSGQKFGETCKRCGNFNRTAELEQQLKQEVKNNL